MLTEKARLGSSGKPSILPGIPGTAASSQSRRSLVLSTGVLPVRCAILLVNRGTIVYHKAGRRLGILPRSFWCPNLKLRVDPLYMTLHALLWALNEHRLGNILKACLVGSLKRVLGGVRPSVVVIADLHIPVTAHVITPVTD